MRAQRAFRTPNTELPERSAVPTRRLVGLGDSSNGLERGTHVGENRDERLAPLLGDRRERVVEEPFPELVRGAHRARSVPCDGDELSAAIEWIRAPLGEPVALERVDRVRDASRREAELRGDHARSCRAVAVEHAEELDASEREPVEAQLAVDAPPKRMIRLEERLGRVAAT